MPFRWQKQKEVEAARLKFQLEEHNTSAPPVSIVVSACGDFKNPVSNNVSLAGPDKVHTLLLSKPSDLTESDIKGKNILFCLFEKNSVWCLTVMALKHCYFL